MAQADDTKPRDSSDPAAESVVASAGEKRSLESDEPLVCCYVRDGMSHGHVRTTKWNCLMGGGEIVDDEECE